MNQKEVGELRRRFRADRSAVSRIYGCYVNGSGEVISYIDESLGMMPQEEAEQYLGLLKKALSGALGKNLVDIVFSTQQVMDSEEHRLLSALRDSGLKDGEARETFYQKVIAALDMAAATTCFCWPTTPTTYPIGARTRRTRRGRRCSPTLSAVSAR